METFTAVESTNSVNPFTARASTILAIGVGLFFYGRLCRSTATAAGEHGARGAVRAEIVDAVDGEEISQPRTGAIDPALDGADCATADRRRVVIREAGSAYQNKRLALICRQLGKRCAEFLEFHAPGLFGMRLQGFGITPLGVFDLAAPLAVLGAEQVA